MTKKIVRDPQMLAIKKQQHQKASPESTGVPKFGAHRSDNEHYSAIGTSDISIEQQKEFFDQIVKEKKDKERRAKSEEWVNWDAALAQLQLADSEDLTTSAWRSFKWRAQKPTSMGPNLADVTGKEFNEMFPPDEKYGEKPLDPNKTLNEVQQMMVREGREQRRGYQDRIAKGKDNIAQKSADFVASVIGGGTAADVALAIFAPQIELGIIGMRHAPQFLKMAAKTMQGLRKSKKLKGTVLANSIEHLVMEGVAIPIENLAQKEKGVKELTGLDIAGRVVMGLLFQASLSSLVHTIKYSDFWRNMFETDPEKAARKWKEQVKLLDEGVPFDEDTLLDSWDQMSPEQQAQWAGERMAVESPDVKSNVPRFEDSGDVLHKYVDEILEMEYQNKLKEYESKGSPEGVEPPKKETFNEIERVHDEAKLQLKDAIDDFVNCLKG
jgi:hypothetical protein